MLAYNDNRLDLLKSKLKIASAETRMRNKCLKSLGKKRFVTRGTLQADAWRLRKDVRHYHLAYGFLRGREYEQIERSCHEPPNFSQVENFVEKFGVKFNWNLPTPQRKEMYRKGKDAQDEQFAAWIERAKEYLTCAKKAA